MHDIHAGRVHPGLLDVAQQDLVEEDIAESHGDPHVGGDQAERHHGSYRAAVQVQAIHHAQQRRDDQRNKRDVHGHQVLAHHGHRQDAGDHQPLRQRFRPPHSRGIFRTQLAHHPACQQSRQTRTGHSHGEGTQQRVTQGDLRASGESILEGDHGGVEPDSTKQPTHEGADK